MKRMLGIAAAVLGLSAGSVLISTPAQAATACDTFYNNTARVGNTYAWADSYCVGLLGGTAGNDANWGDSSGPFQGTDTNRASSVMNRGYSGGRDVVAFYDATNYDWTHGYGCLSIGEKYASYLGDNSLTDGGPASNSISSHQWVYASSCASNSWLT